jgi:hypothetical protein
MAAAVLWNGAVGGAFHDTVVESPCCRGDRTTRLDMFCAHLRPAATVSAIGFDPGIASGGNLGVRTQPCSSAAIIMGVRHGAHGTDHDETK